MKLRRTSGWRGCWRRKRWRRLRICRRTREPSLDEVLYWTNEVRARIEAIATLVREYVPWRNPAYASIRSIVNERLAGDAYFPRLRDRSRRSADAAAGRCTGSRRRPRTAPRAVPSCMPESAETAALIEQLRVDVSAAAQRLRALVKSLNFVSEEAGRIADETDFAFLVNKDRLLLSIGYEFSTGKIHWACYDMLASEARIATYIAVARGELSQQGWFKMSRVHTQAYGCSVLLSWTGTMFEYLMPALWMRSYPETLLSKSLLGAVEIQRAFRREPIICPSGASRNRVTRRRPIRATTTTRRTAFRRSRSSGTRRRVR